MSAPTRLVGLFTAYDLVKRGYSNITIYAEKIDSLASHNAGGLLAPVSMDNDHAMQPIIDQIGIDAYRFYDEVAINSKVFHLLLTLSNKLVKLLT
jgi:glycine/D-amino acid oxidase-like deaminating enzyme